MAEKDFQINRHVEEVIKTIMEHLAHQDAVMAEILDRPGKKILWPDSAILLPDLLLSRKTY